MVKEEIKKDEAVVETTDAVEKTEESVEEPKVEEVKAEETKEEKTEEAVVEPKVEEVKTEETKEEKIEEDTKEEVIEKPNKPTVTQEEFNEVKKHLKSYREKKENLFEIRSIISKEIKTLFGNLKTLKEDRDDLTKNVQDLKDKRDTINSDIKEDIEKIKGFKDVKQPGVERVNIPFLKKEIEKMRYYIETNPLSPDEEKKVMKTIREKEKIIAKNQKAGESKGQFKETSQKVDTLKEESNKIHADVKVLADKSQEKHEKLISNSKDIKYLKAREKEIHALFTDAKDNYKEARKTYIQNKSFFDSGKKKPRKRRDTKEIMKRMEDDVGKKIMSGQKITTEDLLAFRK